MKKNTEKVERISRIENDVDEEYVKRWLPEVETIMDDEIREKTLWLLINASPNSFWYKPTSSTGKYHSDDECGEYGNILHTKRVFIEYLVMSRTYLEQALITEHERECGKAAALLHDMLKYGWPSDRNEHTQHNHDIIGSDVARVIGGMPKEVWSAMHAHNGAWAEGKNPENDYEQILHLSDYGASKPVLGHTAVWNPARELEEAFPDLYTIDDDTFEGLL